MRAGARRGAAGRGCARSRVRLICLRGRCATAPRRCPLCPPWRRRRAWFRPAPAAGRYCRIARAHTTRSRRYALQTPLPLLTARAAVRACAMAQQHDPAEALPQALDVRGPAACQHASKRCSDARCSAGAVPEPRPQRAAESRLVRACAVAAAGPDRARVLSGARAAARCRWLQEFQQSQAAWQARAACVPRLLAVLSCRLRSG